MRIDAEMTTYLTRNLKNNEVCGALTKNGRLTAQKKKKYQYKYSTRRKTFSSIIPAQSIEINRTEIKTLVEKGMMLGLEKRNENRRPNRGNHSRSRSRSETRNSNNRRDKSKSTERVLLPPRNNQNRSTKSKAENIPEKYDQYKGNIFPKGRTKLEKF